MKAPAAVLPAWFALLAFLPFSAAAVEAGPAVAQGLQPLVALTIESEDGTVTVVVPDGGMATYRDYERGHYLGLRPTIVDAAAGEVEIGVFTLTEGAEGPLPAEKEMTRLSAKVDFSEFLPTEARLKVSSRALGAAARAIAGEILQACRGLAERPLSPRGCCVSCGGATTCGVAVSGGCGACCMTCPAGGADR